MREFFLSHRMFKTALKRDSKQIRYLILGHQIMIEHLQRVKSLSSFPYIYCLFVDSNYCYVDADEQLNAPKSSKL
jgi:hypothetical protein